MSDRKKTVNTTDISGEEEIMYTCFYLGDTLCGLDIGLVQEIYDDLDITHVPLAPDYILGVMNLRGQIITVIDQRCKIGLGNSTINESSRVLIVRSNKDYLGLLVDRIADVITTAGKKIQKPPSNVKGLQGAYFHGVIHTESNELLALLDLDTLLLEEAVK